MKPEISLELFHVYRVLYQMIVPVTTSATNTALLCKYYSQKGYMWTGISVCGQIISLVMLKIAPLKIISYFLFCRLISYGWT